MRVRPCRQICRSRVAILAGLLPECRNTLNAKHLPKAVEGSGPLIYRNTEPSLVGDDGAEFSNIAHELCITPADLDTFVRQGPRAVDELPKLLTALGIDEEALSRTQPFLLRDMIRVCASCQQKHQCDRDLDAGTS